MELKQIYTAKDAIQLEDGSWAIDFTLPTTGQGYRVRARSPEEIAGSAGSGNSIL
ncbi:hypothetical protein GCM10022414_13710 [Zhongshania borealis]|uniref:Uncharacterized protein n=1 Tax=Zhongshania borealis TaxID=889488 RepID=A0ABP7WLJ3_9GAMM